METLREQINQDGKVNVKDVLLQREQDRKEKIKTLKEEKDLVPDQVKLFHDMFDECTENITKSVTLVEGGTIDKKILPEHFNKIGKEIQLLNKYLSVSTVFLTNYSVRKSLQTIEELENKVKSLEAEFLPKKKFGFKARKTTKVSDKSTKRLDEVDTSSDKIIKPTLANISCGFSDKKGECLKLCNDISKKDVELRNLENCTVFIRGNPSTIHISNTSKCKILSGPVSTSVFVENCTDCSFVIACQQLRIHSTNNCSFYIHVTSRAIIEDSSEVKFAIYNLEYDGIEKDFSASGLDRSQNNWNIVDDFNWLASDCPSPNWQVINENERVHSWPL